MCVFRIFAVPHLAVTMDVVRGGLGIEEEIVAAESAELRHASHNRKMRWVGRLRGGLGIEEEIVAAESAEQLHCRGIAAEVK